MPARTVREIVDDLLLTRGAFSSGDLARAAGVSRQAVHRHLKAMIARGELAAEGKGRAARYVSPVETFRRRLPRRGLKEDEVWDQIRAALAPLAHEAATRARHILNYAFTKMLNNAIEHSRSRTVGVSFEVVQGTARFAITDQGIGVYENVRGKLRLPSTVAALQEISKGKTTTQPRHSGQGIFFTSKVGDLFELEANGLRWIVDNRREDLAIADVPKKRGTVVRFEVALTTRRQLAAVFARYSVDDFRFDTSRVVVKLFERGVEFVSRSEAKRVLVGLERFVHVILDFKGVEMVGQGFADEVFRVWAGAHPGVRLEPVNMRRAVRLMVDLSRPRS